MNASGRQFYTPLDQSQIEFIPSDSESINGSLTSSKTSNEKVDSPGRESTRSHSSGTRESSLFPRRGSVTMSELIFNNIGRSQTKDSQKEENYALSRMTTTTSLTSNVIDRVRYKILLKLNSRETQLLRESWSMILNEDITNDNVKTKPSTKKGFKFNPMTPLNSQANSARRNSITSVTSATSVIPETKGNVQSNAFASSLFCSQFYANLLSMDSELERMFPSTKHQAVAFAGVINTAIKNLENLQTLETFLQGLGKRHARILGIEPPHFELMGVAFLKTLQDRFGVHCTIELEEVWSRLYSYLANSILQFGIDPYLQIDLNQDTLVFPIPNLQTGASRTVSRLSSHFSETDFISAAPFATRESTPAEPPDRDTSLRNPVQPQPKKTNRLPSRIKPTTTKLSTKKTASKLHLSSNQDCIIM